MKTDRFMPLTSPRSVSQDKIVRDIYAGARDFDAVDGADLLQGDIFLIESLRPVETKQFISLEAYPYAFAQDQDVLSWATALLSESPMAMSLLKLAQSQNWHICLSDLGTGGFHINKKDKIIELDHYGLDATSLGRSAFFRHDLICVLAKALRDISHDMQWDGFEKLYNPESVVMIERARAADTDSLAILIGWELRGAGYSDIWRHILGGRDSDMAEVLTNILDRYPTAIYNGMALAHVFRQWYADTSRVDALDHSTLEYMDNYLNGKIEGHQKFGNRAVAAADFEMLSTLPDGTIYLKELGDTVARDPFFNGLDDPINQAHLFQITYDAKVTYVAGIPFRDAKLARKFLLAD